MKKTLICLSLIFLFLIQGCYTTSQVASNKDQELKDTMDSWIGETKNALLLQWGRPTNVTSDGNGGEIITFEELKRANLQGYGYITVVHNYMFYVDKNNLVYHWNYQRNGRQGH